MAPGVAGKRIQAERCPIPSQTVPQIFNLSSPPSPFSRRNWAQRGSDSPKVTEPRPHRLGQDAAVLVTLGLKAVLRLLRLPQLGSQVLRVEGRTGAC